MITKGTMKGILPVLLTFLSFVTGVSGQQRKVSGIITDAAQEPLTGATVIVKGGEVGTASDQDGKYALLLPAGTTDAVLIFSYVGMRTQELRAKAGSTLNVVLYRDAQDIQEVVVTAYAVRKQEKDLVGSYEQVTAEALRSDRPVESVDKLLEGLAPGVQVEQTTGERGLPVRIRIRGENTLVPVGSTDITASGQPLVVLDGVPLYDVFETNTANTQFGNVLNQRVNPLALLNPGDIESLVVLKDAAATALYGANAANGVILITTKKGKAGKTAVDVKIQQGFEQPINEIQFLNTPQYLELARETLFNSGKNPEDAGASNVATDWRRAVQRTGTFTSAGFTMGGGGDQFNFYFSADHLAQQAIARGNSNQRQGVRINLGQKFGKKFSLNTGLATSRKTKESLNTFQNVTFPPNLPVYADDSTFNNTGPFATLGNPLAVIAQNDHAHQVLSVNGNATLRFEPLPGLYFSTMAGADIFQQREKRYNSALNGTGRNRNGYAIRSNTDNQRWISTTQAGWNTTFREKHHLGLVAGFEAQKRYTDRSIITATNFPFDNLRELNTVNKADIDANTSAYEDASLSGFGQLSYDWDYRYYVSLSSRRDASSIFGGDVQAANFYSAGAAWTFSAAPWMKRFKALSFGKLRMSYGITGNSRLGTYSARGLYVISDNNSYGGFNGFAPSAPPNERLTWQSNRQLNAALDLNFLDSRLKFSWEYYRNTIINAISTIPTPRESGFNTIVANTGDMRNQGMEWSLKADLARNAIFWTSGLNISFNRNEVLRIAVERPPQATDQSSGIVVGNDINAIYGIRAAGVDPYNGKPLWFMPDGSITDDARLAADVRNRVVIGNRTPSFFGGLQNQLGWKQWRLSFMVNYSYGSHILVNNLTFTDGRQISFNNQSVNQLDRWQQPGDITDTPRLHEANFPSRNTTRYLFRNDFLQLANASLSWELPRAIAKKMRISSLRASLQADNLGYLYSTKTRSGRNGIAEYRFIFPQARAVVAGFNIGL
ncbi:MAG: hypothetical protein RL386_1251 [Bacteroidota bacterium]